MFEWLQRQIDSVPGKPDASSGPGAKELYDRALSARLSGIGKIALMTRCLTMYDPQKELLVTRATLHPLKESYGTELDPEGLKLRMLTVSVHNMKGENYVAKIADGLPVEIGRATSDHYVVVFPGASSGLASITSKGVTSTGVDSYRSNLHYLTMESRMRAKVAQDNAGNYACAFVVSFEAPYTIKFRQTISPTRNSPFEVNSNVFAMYGRLHQMTVFNRLTGQIYDQVPRLNL